MKKLIFVFFVLSFSSIVYAQNQTGVVIAKENATVDRNTPPSGREVMTIVYIDSNNDKIIDAVLFLSIGNVPIYNSEDINQRRPLSTNLAPLTDRTIDYENILLLGYINIGSTIIYNVQDNQRQNGVYYLTNQNIISVNGITKDRMLSR